MVLSIPNHDRHAFRSLSRPEDMTGEVSPESCSGKEGIGLEGQARDERVLPACPLAYLTYHGTDTALAECPSVQQFLVRDLSEQADISAQELIRIHSELNYIHAMVLSRTRELRQEISRLCEWLNDNRIPAPPSGSSDAIGEYVPLHCKPFGRRRVHIEKLEAVCATLAVETTTGYDSDVSVRSASSTLTTSSKASRKRHLDVKESKRKKHSRPTSRQGNDDALLSPGQPPPASKRQKDGHLAWVSWSRSFRALQSTDLGLLSTADAEFDRDAEVVPSIGMPYAKRWELEDAAADGTADSGSKLSEGNALCESDDGHTNEELDLLDAPTGDWLGRVLAAFVSCARRTADERNTYTNNDHPLPVKLTDNQQLNVRIMGRLVSLGIIDEEEAAARQRELCSDAIGKELLSLQEQLKAQVAANTAAKQRLRARAVQSITFDTWFKELEGADSLVEAAYRRRLREKKDKQPLSKPVMEMAIRALRERQGVLDRQPLGTESTTK